MIKKIVIAGCRNFDDYPKAKAVIDLCIHKIKEKYTLIFVSGGCKGADSLGEQYALKHGFTVEKYPADWKRYGKGAGPQRNRKMAEVGDYILCFWDGKSRGTKSMIEYALKMGKPIKIVMI